jgi:hypothetical protein
VIFSHCACSGLYFESASSVDRFKEFRPKVQVGIPQWCHQCVLHVESILLSSWQMSRNLGIQCLTSSFSSIQKPVLTSVQCFPSASQPLSVGLAISHICSLEPPAAERRSIVGSHSVYKYLRGEKRNCNICIGPLGDG